MNLVCYIVLLKTIFLIDVSIETRASTIKALLQQRKCKSSNSMPFYREPVKVEAALQMSPTLRKDFCSYFSQPNWNDGFPISKKSAPLCCNCDEEEIKTDLGGDFLPRYIPERKCISTSYGACPMICKEKTYSVKVLKWRGMNEEEDTFLPRPLNRYWSFSTINVTVACHCDIFY